MMKTTTTTKEKGFYKTTVTRKVIGRNVFITVVNERKGKEKIATFSMSKGELQFLLNEME